MSKYVSFLRAINVGGHTVKMDHLRRLFEALGFANVETFIRSTSEVAAIAKYKPFAESELSAEGNMLYIGFVSGKPSNEAKQNLLSSATKTDEFHIFEREIYWLCRKMFHESKFSGGLIEKILAMPATFRNSTTIRKIAAKYS